MGAFREEKEGGAGRKGEKRAGGAHQAETRNQEDEKNSGRKLWMGA